MSRRYWALTLALASLWGASYLFIKIGLRDLSPAMVVFTRTALAAVVLVPLAARRDALSHLRGAVGPVVALSAMQIAAPFMLISVGEQTISSSLAGILIASAPLFTALLAVWLDQGERLQGPGLAGTVAGFAGVALLLGVDLGGEAAELIGGALVLLAGLGYALGGFYVKRRFAEVQPIGVSAAAMVASALLLLPAAALSAPGSAPGLGPAAAMVALGIGGTGIAFLIYYTLIAEAGPAKASLVAYLAPGFAVLYGVTLLGEDVTVWTFAGLALIVGGSWLAAGSRARRPAVEPVPPEPAPQPSRAG